MLRGETNLDEINGLGLHTYLERGLSTDTLRGLSLPLHGHANFPTLNNAMVETAAIRYHNNNSGSESLYLSAPTAWDNFDVGNVTQGLGGGLGMELGLPVSHSDPEQGMRPEDGINVFNVFNQSSEFVPANSADFFSDLQWASEGDNFDLDSMLALPDFSM